jgi:serine phosphatase RsbU (regulator of sigma subunit)
MENTAYQTTSVAFAANDLVMLFTDGLYEVENAANDLYTQSLLIAGVERSATLPAGKLFDSLLQEIRAFSGGGGFTDDVCLVGMEFKA